MWDVKKSGTGKATVVREEEMEFGVLMARVGYTASVDVHFSKGDWDTPDDVSFDVVGVVIDDIAFFDKQGRVKGSLTSGAAEVLLDKELLTEAKDYIVDLMEHHGFNWIDELDDDEYGEDGDDSSS